jgi:hypothetical protein
MTDIDKRFPVPAPLNVNSTVRPDPSLVFSPGRVPIDMPSPTEGVPITPLNLISKSTKRAVGIGAVLVAVGLAIALPLALRHPGSAAAAPASQSPMVRSTSSSMQSVPVVYTCNGYPLSDYWLLTPVDSIKYVSFGQSECKASSSQVLGQDGDQSAFVLLSNENTSVTGLQVSVWDYSNVDCSSAPSAVIACAPLN